MSKANSNKKPFFRQAWFWIVIVIILIGIGSMAGGKSDEPQKVGNSESSIQTADANSEFGVGDIIDIDGQEISVTSIERNYTPDNSFAKVSDGKEYIKVNLQIQNKSKETKNFNALDWKIESGDGVIDDYLSSALAQADDNLSSGDLATNGTKRGSIVFEVPAGDTGLKVHFSPSFWSNKDVIIKL